MARLGTPVGRREACHHHAPLCLWHANLVPRPAPLCASRGAHLACPWRAGGLSLTFTQPSLFAIAMLPTPKPMQLGPQKLNYCCSPQVHCWLGLPQDYGSTNSKNKVSSPSFYFSHSGYSDISQKFPPTSSADITFLYWNWTDNS